MQSQSILNQIQIGIYWSRASRGYFSRSENHIFLCNTWQITHSDAKTRIDHFSSIYQPQPRVPEWTCNTKNGVLCVCVYMWVYNCMPATWCVVLCPTFSADAAWLWISLTLRSCTWYTFESHCLLEWRILSGGKKHPQIRVWCDVAHLGPQGLDIGFLFISFSHFCRSPLISH